MRDLWVFGYGSLMWRPNFDFIEAAPALLHGAHRSLCVYSWVHRGTKSRPGLVLGLDRGGACRGMAFRVAGGDADAVIAYLRQREQVTSVYCEARRPVRLGGETISRVEAVCYLVDRDHRQYAGPLSTDEQVNFVRQGKGQSGDNREYILNTVNHLKAMKLKDPGLFAVADRLR
jgi:cation transport protein ChaC